MRIAGDDPGYSFRLVHTVNGVATKATKYGFEMPSVSTFINETLAKPPSAMAWWGYRVALKAVVDALADDPVAVIDASTSEVLEAALKERGVSPNMKRDEAGDRGSKAHDVLEYLAKYAQAVDLSETPGDPEPTFRTMAEAYAEDEVRSAGTEYGIAAIAFWDEQIQPHIDRGEIIAVLSEEPVWSIKLWYAGTFDLALLWSDCTDECRDAEPHMGNGWEILDAKTHKPASGFTKPGKGAGYIADATQIRAYRMGHEEMGLGQTFGQRTIVLRDKAYKGVRYLEDDREVPEDFVRLLRAAYDVRVDFEKGE